jgi:TP901 family phage tail tape measure protein
MASEGSVRAGGAFVEIFAKDGPFQQAMSRVENRLKMVGQKMRQLGTSASLAGAAIGIPMVMAARQAATFEDALLGMEAAAGLSADQVKALEKESLRLSKSMGVDPAKIANAFLELTKAGMSVEEVLAGAGKSAVEFARVSGVEMVDAAVFMKVAMNTFGVSATQAVDTLSAAADASETSIAAMVESFALVGSAGKTFDQSLFDVSQGLAALAKYGIRGEEAGTGIKTMLMRLTSPADTAHEALAKVGLTVASFRDMDGRILPIVQIVDVLAKAMQNVDRITRDQVLGDVFGDRGIRVVGAFLDMGVAGFGDLAKAMEGNLPVATKFQILMSGISGAFSKLSAAVQRLSIAFAGALGASLDSATAAIVNFLDGVSALLQKFPVLAKIAAGAAAGLVLFGIVAITAGISLMVLSKTLGAVAKAIAFIVTPMGATVTAVVGGIALMLVAAYQLSPAFREEANAIMAALGRLDFAAAWQVMNLNLAIALTQMAQQFENAWAGVRNGVVAAAAFIGDKLIEGLDRFMTLFGADILTLQAGLEKLGLIFKAAFDWNFAQIGLRAAIQEVDDRIARERERSPTAGSRAADRRSGRDQAAAARAAADKARNDGYEQTIDTLREDLEKARKAAIGETQTPQEQASTVRRSPARDPMGEMPPAAGMAGNGIGRTIGTFASEIAGRLGAGPELSAAERTANATERTAVGVEALMGMGDFGPGGKPQLGGMDKALMAAVDQSKVTPPAPGGTDRELVSSAEKTASGIDAAVNYLRQIATAANRGGLQFA